MPLLAGTKAFGRIDDWEYSGFMAVTGERKYNFYGEKQMEQGILGFLFSYNFSPKSRLYFAVNEIRDRSDQYDLSGNLLPNRLHVVDRVSVFKLRYLYYF